MLEKGAFLAVFEDALDDVACLVGLVADGDQAGFDGRGAVGPQVLGEAFFRLIDDAIGGGQDRLGRTIVAVERDMPLTCALI